MRFTISRIFIFLILPFLLQCAINSDKTAESTTATAATGDSTLLELPDIMHFHTSPTTQFLVSMNVIVDGHMYRGKNALDPHTGGHVHFNNADGTWPKGTDKPENYPAIYAIADGIVSRVDTYFEVKPDSGKHYRYGITLDIATSKSGGIFKFSYRIIFRCIKCSFQRI